MKFIVGSLCAAAVMFATRAMHIGEWDQGFWTAGGFWIVVNSWPEKSPCHG